MLLVFLALIFINSRELIPLPLGAMLGINVLIFGMIIFCFFHGLLVMGDVYQTIFRVSILATLLAIIPILTILIYGFFVELILGHKVGEADGFLLLVLIPLIMLLITIYGLFSIFKSK